MAANSRAMLRTRADLERHLLHKSLGTLARDRHRCAECGRTPLVGERVHLYDRDVLCALCRPARPAEPDRTEVVLHSEHGHAVRRRAA
jgi:hypothetical protein